MKIIITTLIFIFIWLFVMQQTGPNVLHKVKVTAYCACGECCGKYADGITASGYKLRKGNKLCASSFDFCTVLKIPGYGIAPVLDRGGNLWNENHIDVYFDKHEEALEWGVQYLEVEVLE